MAQGVSNPEQQILQSLFLQFWGKDKDRKKISEKERGRDEEKADIEEKEKTAKETDKRREGGRGRTRTERR